MRYLRQSIRSLCVKCQVEYRCEKNSVGVEDSGRLWDADLYKCPVCGHEIITSFGSQPIAEIFEATYPKVLLSYVTYGLYKVKQLPTELPATIASREVRDGIC